MKIFHIILYAWQYSKPHLKIRSLVFYPVELQAQNCGNMRNYTLLAHRHRPPWRLSSFHRKYSLIALAVLVSLYLQNTDAFHIEWISGLNLSLSNERGVTFNQQNSNILVSYPVKPPQHKVDQTIMLVYVAWVGFEPTMSLGRLDMSQLR